MALEINDNNNKHLSRKLLLLRLKMKTKIGTQKQLVEQTPVAVTRHSTQLQEKEFRTDEEIEDEVQGVQIRTPYLTMMVWRPQPPLTRILLKSMTIKQFQLGKFILGLF